MRRIFSIVVPTLLLLVLAAYIAGVRVFVIQPIGAIPEGVTAIVYGVPGLRPIDSPDAFCEREQGYVNLLCRGVTAGMVARDGKILMRLPYSDWLYAMSGAPPMHQ